jgi:hypothetical protein
MGFNYKPPSVEHIQKQAGDRANTIVSYDKPSSGRLKKQWFGFLYRFLRANNIDFKIGWKGMAEAMEELAGASSKGLSPINRAIAAYWACDRNSIVIPKSGPPDGKRSQKELSEAERKRRFFASYAWKRLRYKTFLRYGRQCKCCGTDEGVMHVDHIKPISKYWHLRLDPDNVQVLCDDCNEGKSNWDETDFRLT